ncbi:MAG TPA: hypothetical protein VF148_05160 [Acidimicrobiia bacterium]
MPEYKVNKEAVVMAKRRIAEGKYDRETEWSDPAPSQFSADEGNAVIEDAGYDEYGSWHLGIDTGASDDTKNRFGFPYGDFSEVNRSALIQQRASQNGHDEIVDVADELLQHLDEVSSG